ncbi:hypothetical protein KKF82_08055 [Patescibacteria group bacterium]|uniref:Uncharacterized protein n=1 Tax=viral metagenome TaxID=1070528 RepID=A0A6M3M496_9ZZZZ|nr:hypothetical protein [Patescibacteria group bacterium]
MSMERRDIVTKIIEDAYTKSYKMRIVGEVSVEATLPRIIVEREAKKLGLTIEEFIESHRVEYLFNDFGGAFVRFRKAE